MIKVCILTSVHPPFDVRIFHKEAKSLLMAGYDLSIIAQHDKDEIINGIKIFHLPRPQNRLERMTKLIWLIFWKAIRINAHIYHIHDPELLPAGFLMKLLGKKIIYDMHENLPKQIMNKEWINSRLRNILSTIVYVLERLSLMFMAVIFAECSYRKDYLWIKKCTIVLNMPIINQLFAYKCRTSMKNDFSIGYMGGVTTERGSVTTLDALKILKDNNITLRYDCVGPITQPHKRQLLMKCKEYDLKNIYFHGYLPAHQGWQVIGHCSIGLALLHPIPNYIESYPTKIFEYMAMGIPVIASNFPLYRRVVEESHCGICVDPLNPKEIAGAIQFVIDHPAESKQMGENGYRAVVERYNWDKEADKLISFYRCILSKECTGFNSNE